MRSTSTIALLSLSTAASLGAAIAAVVVLNPEDRISILRGFALTALGLVFFSSLFELLNRAALDTQPGRRLCKRYRLTSGHVLDINNKLVSAVQAVFCCVTGVVVCGWSCPRDLLHASHFMSEAYAWFGAAYFFYDIWSMYKVHILMNSDDVRDKGPVDKMSRGAGDAGTARRGKLSQSFLAYCRNEPVIIFHHLFIGGFGFLVIVYLRGGLGDCVFGLVYLMELSTPFVSARGILSRLGLKASSLYVANGLTMLTTFLVCRVLSLPYAMFMYSRVVNLSYWEAIETLPTGCKISISILLLPQLYWFYLMSAGALKVLRPSPTPAAAPALNNNTRQS